MYRIWKSRVGTRLIERIDKHIQRESEGASGNGCSEVSLVLNIDPSDEAVGHGHTSEAGELEIDCGDTDVSDSLAAFGGKSSTLSSIESSSASA